MAPHPAGPVVPLPLVAAIAVAFVAAILLLWRRIERDDRLAARVRAVRRDAGADVIAAPARGSAGGMVAAVVWLGEGIARSGLLSSATLDELQQTLRVSGFYGPNGLSLFVAAKLLLLAGLPVLMIVLPRLTGWQPPIHGVLVAASGILGLLAPDQAVRMARKRYLKRLERGLPDALDMMVICSEAGLGLEASIERVGLEIARTHPEMAEELLQAGREVRVNADRRAALLNMGTRTGLDSLRRLGGTLVQSAQYGTPLSQALRTLSVEMRQEMLTRFEARAARLPVLLTLPMIIFILPCVFMVVAGPAMVQVLKTLRH